MFSKCRLIFSVRLTGWRVRWLLLDQLLLLNFFQKHFSAFFVPFADTSPCHLPFFFRHLIPIIDSTSSPYRRKDRINWLANKRPFQKQDEQNDNTPSRLIMIGPISSNFITSPNFNVGKLASGSAEGSNGIPFTVSGCTAVSCGSPSPPSLEWL